MNHPLATRLAEEIDARGMSVELLAERTKVHRSTLLTLLDEPVNAVVPPRIYLRGHALVVAKELGLSSEETVELFEASFPVKEEETIDLDMPRFPKISMALAAGLGGIAVLAIVLAFAT